MNDRGQDGACAEASFVDFVLTKNRIEHEPIALIDENGREGETRKWYRRFFGQDRG